MSDEKLICPKCGAPTKDNGRYYPDLGMVMGFEAGLEENEDRLKAVTAERDEAQGALAELMEELGYKWGSKACNQPFLAARKLKAERDALREALPMCHSHTDGDCVWEHCPQMRDGEPAKSGRHCPLDLGVDEEGEREDEPPQS